MHAAIGMYGEAARMRQDEAAVELARPGGVLGDVGSGRSDRGRRSHPRQPRGDDLLGFGDDPRD
jgi:hypothetical protein